MLIHLSSDACTMRKCIYFLFLFFILQHNLFGKVVEGERPAEWKHLAPGAQFKEIYNEKRYSKSSNLKHFFIFRRVIGAGHEVSC